MIEGNSVEFTWSGNDEMDQVDGDGWAELRDDGTLEGQIYFQGGDEAEFVARCWRRFSTAAEHQGSDGTRVERTSATLALCFRALVI
jgi:hypothetical protein